jgi:hypothetical protein
MAQRLGDFDGGAPAGMERHPDGAARVHAPQKRYPQTGRPKIHHRRQAGRQILWSRMDGKGFDTRIVVDNVEHAAPTHKVDCYKNRVALEVEWNNKDPFYDRDLNNFRLLFDLRAIDAGVIVTRCTELQTIFDALGRGPSYGSSTTHMAKLRPRLDGGSGGGCPVVVFGIRKAAYVEDEVQ